MEVPSNPNGPRLVPLAPQIDPKYLSMAMSELYSAYNAKQMFSDEEISKNIEDVRHGEGSRPTRIKSRDEVRLKPGTTPGDATEKVAVTAGMMTYPGQTGDANRLGFETLSKGDQGTTPAIHRPGTTPNRQFTAAEARRYWFPNTKLGAN